LIWKDLRSYPDRAHKRTTISKWNEETDTEETGDQMDVGAILKSWFRRSDDEKTNRDRHDDEGGKARDNDEDKGKEALVLEVWKMGKSRRFIRYFKH